MFNAEGNLGETHNGIIHIMVQFAYDFIITKPYNLFAFDLKSEVHVL